MDKQEQWNNDKREIDWYEWGKAKYDVIDGYFSFKKIRENHC